LRAGRSKSKARSSATGDDIDDVLYVAGELHPAQPARGKPVTDFPQVGMLDSETGEVGRLEWAMDQGVLKKA